MKSGRLMWIATIAVCAMLTSAVPLAGQDKQAHKHHHYQLIDVGTRLDVKSNPPRIVYLDKPRMREDTPLR